MALGVVRGQRTLVITSNGGKVVAVPLAPRMASAVDVTTGGRNEEPVFLAAVGRHLVGVWSYQVHASGGQNVR